MDTTERKPEVPVMNDTEWYMDFFGHSHTLEVSKKHLGDRFVLEKLFCSDLARRELYKFESYREYLKLKDRLEKMECPFKTYFKKGPNGAITPFKK